MSYFEEHGGPSIEKHNVFVCFWCYSLVAQIGGWGDGGGLGLTDCVIAVRPEFPAPCGVTPVAVGSGDPGAAAKERS